jgi:FRG domain
MSKRPRVRDGIQEFELDSWKDFFQLGTELFALAPAYIYRGQADYAWPIVSRLDRLENEHPRRKHLGGKNPEFFDTSPYSEDEHLAAFRRAIRGRGVSTPLTDEEYWALGQHHGLATPLTDWTRSPYMALYFAFEDATSTGHRAVYALSTHAIQENLRGDNSDIGVVSPMSDCNYRLVSQAAVLVRLTRRKNLESYVRERFADDSHRGVLVKIKIPNADRIDCLVALNKMGINRMVLFPDIDGAAKHVNSLWEPGREDSIAYF